MSQRVGVKSPGTYSQQFAAYLNEVSYLNEPRCLRGQSKTEVIQQKCLLPVCNELKNGNNRRFSRNANYSSGMSTRVLLLLLKYKRLMPNLIGEGVRDKH